MKCPECHHPNPDNKRFCRECGAKLTRPCPQCGGGILYGDQFCGECGCNLQEPARRATGELSAEEKLRKLRRYLPRRLTDKILARKDKIEGERKQATVMFCDMAGYARFSESIEPERLYSIMDRVYEILIRKVHEYGGTVNEMTGDGILAFFGMANYLAGLTASWQCQFKASLEFFEKCLALAAAIDRPVMIAITKAGISAHTHCLQGTLVDAREIALSAAADSQNSNDPVASGIADAAYGIACFYQGALDDAIPYLLQGYQRARVHNAWPAHIALKMNSAAGMKPFG